MACKTAKRYKARCSLTKKQNNNLNISPCRRHNETKNILSTFGWPFSGKSLRLNKDTNNNFSRENAARRWYMEREIKWNFMSGVACETRKKKTPHRVGEIKCLREEFNKRHATMALFAGHITSQKSAARWGEETSIARSICHWNICRTLITN